MPLTEQGYVPVGMKPAGAAAPAGFGAADPKTANATVGFAPSWSWMPDPDAPPQCSARKKDGSPCQARPVDEGLCIGHSRKR